MLYKIAEKVIGLEREGKKIIKFNVGDPDQNTPREIIRAALFALKKGKTKYGSAAGEKRLREKIAGLYKTKPEKVIIAPGSKWAVFSALSLILKKEDNLILISPHWTAYELMAKKIGAEIKFLKTELESNWEINLEELEKLIDRRTKMMILNNPHNPTSKVFGEKTIKGIVDLANKNSITILSDETYSDISFKKVKSILDFKGNHIFINSFSKTFAMTGWRLGFAIVKNELARKMTEFNQMTITCVPPFIQEAGLLALEQKAKISNSIKKIYKKRAELATRILSKTKLKFRKPDAPFYLFPKCFSDSEKLALKLLEEGVAITPGSAFGDYKEYFRIALTLPDKELKEGLKKIVKVFK